MLQLIRVLLAKYQVIEVAELHAVWDFSAWLLPHTHTLRGYSTGQFGDGMHEFLIRKDAEGIVRLYLR
eukprot:2791182-Pleurochrysis_carterae.AAC.1